MKPTRSAVGRRAAAACAVAAAALLAAGPLAAPATARQKPTPDLGVGAIGAPRTYDPNYEPRTDPNSPEFDPNYDPRTDMNHPLKNRGRDPGHAWDRPRRGDGTPPVRQASGEWSWGELFYGKTYHTKIVVKNGCSTPRTATIFVHSLPYLTLPSSVTVPAKSQKEVPGTIVTPPPPHIFLTGHETLPPHGIFVDLEQRHGEVVIWHPWGKNCAPSREAYSVTGHIHYDTRKPPDPGPQRIATASPCQVWWNIGERPAQLDYQPKDCTDEIRELARGYVTRVLGPSVSRDPAAWSWLPDEGRIQQMSIDELLAMKARADLQMAGKEQDR